MEIRMIRKLSTAGVRREYRAYRCNGHDRAEISILGRAPVRVMGLWVPAWKRLEEALVAAGYPHAEIVSSYNCRSIRDRVLPSLHSYRAAIDIDPRLNARAWRLDYSRTRITADQVRAVESLHTVDGWQAFVSGVHFRHKDPMHFQIAAPIQSIKLGLIGGKAHPAVKAPPRREVAPLGLPVIRKGSSGQAVRNLQGLLEARGQGISIDGRFGSATDSAVRRFQFMRKLGVDGVVGARTWAALLDG